MTPLVTVILLTYNHKNYIEECLESVVSQNTNFAFEIIIGDDCSSDGTRAICEVYSTQYPDLIKLIPREKNIGLPDNLIQTLAYTKGNFVAFIEGDDYWTDKNKLQTQFDILQENPIYQAVTHNSDVIYPTETKVLLQNPKEIFTLEDTKNGRIFHTNSWFIRKEALPNFKQYHSHLICWDILMELKIMEHGPIYFINKTMSIWRKHEGGNSVKIPLKEQYYNFESLYNTLLNERKYIQHYKSTQQNFYKIFAFEIARRDSVLFLPAIKKHLVSQLKTLKFDIKFIPRLLLNCFNWPLKEIETGKVILKKK